MDHAQHAHPVEAGGWWSDLLGGGFMPHGHCYAWRPDILWLHVVSDALIALAYYSIPIILISFVARRRDVPFNWMFVLFGVFIFACGTTHVIEIISVWEPVYKLGGLIKALTAAVSMAAAVMLVPLMPKALALPSLRSAHRELQATAGELQRSNRELEQFAYVASHDLQEPLRMVSMYLDLLAQRQDPVADPKAAGYLQIASDGATRMRALIDDLLGYSRIAHGESGITLVDCGAALVAALDNLAPKIHETRARIARGELPAVRGNASQIAQVFQNLVGNALKFAGQGPPQVQVSARRQGGDWLFTVQDQGIGIEPRHHERVFALFQRLHSASDYPGTGIGLAVCKKIVERHGGRIWVESPSDSGARFCFTLPADAPANAPATQRAP